MAEKSKDKTTPKDKSSDTLLDLIMEATSLAGKTSIFSIKLVKRLLQSKTERKKEPSPLLKEAGSSIRELRKLVGITQSELAKAVEISDTSLIEAIESGTATLSFDLILRLASILARHDPVPFVFKMLRSYYPDIWQELGDWGVSGITDKFERERLFINVLRQHDDARSLTHEEFELVLKFTGQAFEMAMGFVLNNRKESAETLTMSREQLLED